MTPKPIESAPAVDPRPFVRGQVLRSSEFPRFLFRGATEEAIADNQEAADKLLTAGWYLTRPEAIEATAQGAGPASPAPVKPAPNEGDAPPARVELMSKAEELGIRFDDNWTDERLRAAIDKELKHRNR